MEILGSMFSIHLFFLHASPWREKLGIGRAWTCKTRALLLIIADLFMMAVARKILKLQAWAYSSETCTQHTGWENCRWWVKQEINKSTYNMTSNPDLDYIDTYVLFRSISPGRWAKTKLHEMVPVVWRPCEVGEASLPEQRLHMRNTYPPHCEPIHLERQVRTWKGQTAFWSLFDSSLWRCGCTDYVAKNRSWWFCSTCTE